MYIWHGSPVDNRGTSLTLNTAHNCLDVWSAVLSHQSPVTKCWAW